MVHMLYDTDIIGINAMILMLYDTDIDSLNICIIQHEYDTDDDICMSIIAIFSKISVSCSMIAMILTLLL